jgi:hypothetical protein
MSADEITRNTKTTDDAELVKSFVMKTSRTESELNTKLNSDALDISSPKSKQKRRRLANDMSYYYSLTDVKYYNLDGDEDGDENDFGADTSETSSESHQTTSSASSSSSSLNNFKQSNISLKSDSLPNKKADKMAIIDNKLQKSITLPNANEISSYCLGLNLSTCKSSKSSSLSSSIVSASVSPATSLSSFQSSLAVANRVSASIYKNKAHKSYSDYAMSSNQKYINLRQCSKKKIYMNRPHSSYVISARRHYENFKCYQEHDEYDEDYNEDSYEDEEDEELNNYYYDEYESQPLDELSGSLTTSGNKKIFKRIKCDLCTSKSAGKRFKKLKKEQNGDEADCDDDEAEEEQECEFKFEDSLKLDIIEETSKNLRSVNTTSAYDTCSNLSNELSSNLAEVGGRGSKNGSDSASSNYGIMMSSSTGSTSQSVSPTSSDKYEPNEFSSGSAYFVMPESSVQVYACHDDEQIVPECQEKYDQSILAIAASVNSTTNSSMLQEANLTVNPNVLVTPIDETSTTATDVSDPHWDGYTSSPYYSNSVTVENVYVNEKARPILPWDELFFELEPLDDISIKQNVSDLLNLLFVRVSLFKYILSQLLSLV